jgi:hypothetical protein
LSRIFFVLKVNLVRNSSGALNPAGILLERNPAAEQQGIISNGVNRSALNRTICKWALEIVLGSVWLLK